MKRALILVNVTGLLVGISYGLHGPILPVFAKNVIGASYTEIGLIGFANFIPYMFIPLFVGLLLDRFNNGYLLSIGVVINSTSVYLLSIAQSVPEIMGFRIMTGIAHAFFWPPSVAIISNVSDGRQRVRNIARFTGFFVAGFTIGPLIGSILLENLDVSLRIVFQIAAFILAFAIISSLSSSRYKIREHAAKFSFDAIREMKKFPHVIIMLIYCTSTFGIILTVYPAFLNDNSMSDVQIEMLFFIFGISRIATLLVAGKLARRTSHTLIAAAASIATGLLISFGAESMIEFAVAFLFMGFGFSIFFPLTIEIILSKTRKEISGTIIGSYETIFGIGWAIGPISAGIISEIQANSTPYLIFFAIGIGVTILSIIKRKELEPKKNPNL
ncbi:MAG: MFS transporter [Crenarchaeota archaeon]|nr:MAG: MFS transporter [Thermoproteota archaeon]RDJ32984.1 MAG: MFS transporter [Thermoproteota archaeon]RDJ35814.1 MAG: MFS transporter [Thermoproteota archaeon]RDJ36512.1 MAG: MFS transporter [Thermoproteota archaeon]